MWCSFLSGISTQSCDFSPSDACVCSFQSCLVGIVVPDPEYMPEWAKKKGIVGTYKDLCKNTVGDAWLKLFQMLFVIDVEDTEEFYGG